MARVVRESEYFLAWLAFFACTTIGGLVLGGAVGFVLGVILGAAGVEPKALTLLGGALGFVLSLPVSYGFFRLFVSKMIVQRVAGRLGAAAPPPAGAAPDPP